MHEINIYGVFVSPLLPCAVLALLANAALRRLLNLTGIGRIVWHRPLFDLALFVIVLGGVTALTSVWVQS
jgi:uncharacterized membrane protein YhfC